MKSEVTLCYFFFITIGFVNKKKMKNMKFKKDNQRMLFYYSFSLKRIKIFFIPKFFYSQSVNKKDWPLIYNKLDNNKQMSAYQLANSYIKSGKLITATEVNNVLASFELNITQETLDNILNSSRLNFSNLDANTIKSDSFIQNIGTVRGKKVPGVYIWTHLYTGDKYVGSSSTLARRLIGYFNGTHVNSGKLIPLIKKEGVNAFSLQVIPLTENYIKYQKLCIEQYFFITFWI